MNYGVFKDTVIKILNQYSNQGSLTAETDGNVQDALLRFPVFANIGLNEIATTAKYIHKKKRISQNPIPNMLPNPLTTFDVMQHLGTDIISMSAKGAKSYYFEVDNVADIYIEEEYPTGVWNLLQTINHTTPKGEYTIYKGFTGCTDVTRNVRVRFGGNYPYNIRNRALFAFTFPTIADIPNYQKYTEYTMPNDFYMLNKVVNTGNNMLRQNTVDWEFQGRNVIAINYFLVGSIDIFYYAYPTYVPDDVADNFVFDIDEEACQALCFYVASQVWIDDVQNKGVAATLYAIYQGKLGNMTNAVTQGSTLIKNSLFTGDSTMTTNKLF